MCWQAPGQRLARSDSFCIAMQFGAPQVLSDGCVLLRPTHGAEHYQQLWRSILGPSAKHHDAHITLLHPRNAAGITYDLAEIARALAGLTTIFRTISLIEQQGDGPWLVRHEYGAAF